MFKRVLWVSVLFGCSGLGCELRVQPMWPDGSVGPSGAGGNAGVVGTGGRGGVSGGGTGGRGASGGIGATAGSSAGSSGGMVITGTGGNTDAGIPDASPDLPSCTGGGVCTPANACHVGETTCSASGVASCMDTQTRQANGTVCGQNMVCNNGSCAACAAGSACTPSNPCRTGTVACTTGAAVCTENADKPNGTSCGAGMVCTAGQCTACQQGAACTPADLCHQGMLACSTGTPVCTDRNLLVPAGTSCGTDRVCNAVGACGPCKVGATCTVTGRPCRTGTTTCNTGVAVCVEQGNVANGTSCGTNLVCSSGSCVSCTTGLTCMPANPCHAGTQTCSPAITCADTGRNLVNGTVCGTNRVCNNGSCLACTAGASCQPTNPCRTGATSCVTGASVCAETGNVANGSTCGTNRVCNNGSCVACAAGGACTPTNPCHTGTLTCTTGSSTCQDTGTNVANGTSCGTDRVCRAGSCVACVAGNACTPSDPCKLGTTSCATGTSACVTSGNRPVGTLCGAAQSCTGGVRTSAAMCTAAAACTTTTTTCPSACNAAGTDCNACAAGETMCTNGCQSLGNDPDNCGTCGLACAVPPVAGSGSATCGASGCGFVCNASYLKCGGGTTYCQVSSWGFEGTTTDGFGNVSNGQTAVTSISVSGSVFHSGAQALAIKVNAQGTGGERTFVVGLRLCGGNGFVPANAQAVSAWFYLSPDPDTVPPPDASSQIGERLTTTMSEGGSTSPAMVGAWFQVTTPIGSLGNQLVELAVQGVFGPDSDWTGTVYVDDIVIQ